MDIARDRGVQLGHEKSSYMRLHQSEMARLTEYERGVSYLEQDMSNIERLVEHFENRTKELERDAEARQTMPASHNRGLRPDAQIPDFQAWMRGPEESVLNPTETLVKGRDSLSDVARSAAASTTPYPPTRAA